MKDWFVIAILVFAVCSSIAVAGPPEPTFTRTNAQIQIPQIVAIQTSEPYAVTPGLILYSENGVSVIIIENKTLTNGENIKTYYIDFIASRLPPDAYVILSYVYPPQVTDTYVTHGMAPQELRAILTVDVPELENHLLTENVALDIKSATDDDILRQFAIWAYMGVDLMSMKGYWLSLGLGEGAWEEAENWLASFAMASPAEDITELDPSISVSYEAQGYSIIIIQLTNNGAADAYIRAEVGTILNNKNGANQNITIGETGVVLVPAGASKRMRLESYCINLFKGTPARIDVLIPTKEKNEALSTFLCNAAGAGYTGMSRQHAVQEAVWYITDERAPSSAEAQKLLSDNAEVRTWGDLGATPWNPESSTEGTSSALLLAILLVISPAAVWFLLKGKMVVKIWVVAIVFTAAVAVASIPLPSTHIATTGLTTDGHSSGSSSGWQQVFEQNQLRQFSSYKELKHFIEANLETFAHYPYGYYIESSWGTQIAVPIAVRDESIVIGAGAMFTVEVTNTGNVFDAYELAVPFAGSWDSASGSGVSKDFSATNIQVWGVDEADIVKNDGKFIYVVSGNKVVIINAYPAENARILSEIEEDGNPIDIFINENKLVVFGRAFAKVYDISDRENPLLKRDISFDGSYFDSRMIGDYVYAIINSPIYYHDEGEVDLPEISSNNRTRVIPACEIYYFDFPDYSYKFTTIMAVNTQNDNEEISSETFLMGAAQNIFVSSNNIYITYTTYNRGKRLNWMGGWETEKTTIHKVSITNGKIEYKSQGEVSGHVLNQFSMDEYQGYFRVATTTEWEKTQNHVYILDENLKIVGKLEGIAPTERIYSARFIGERVYLVTFRRVDPLFVIDLKDPSNPKVLGELKIPGYSDYLHPYDENHIIGVGRETGVKIALFDVSDPEHPKEISKYEAGGWGTDSYALGDHKAFLFSRSKNLLVIPIGEYWSQDAHVFHISVDNGIVLRGNISHSENNVYSGSGYRYFCDCSVKRSLYIENVLYTISDGLIKMNNLEDLSEINSVVLRSNEGGIGWYLES